MSKFNVKPGVIAIGLILGSLCGATFAADTKPNSASGARSFGQSNHQPGSMRVQRLDFDSNDRAQNAGVSIDASGNTGHAQNGTSYSYDAANRLIKSVSADAVPMVVEYYYDGLGQLIRTKTNGVISDYVLDESGGLPRVIGEITGSTQQLYFYGPEGLHAQRKLENGVAQPVQYALNDGLGSVKGITDASGNVVSTRSYNAWGEVRYQSGPSQKLGYTGEQSFADGSVYLRARSYLPEQGRFLQRDSFAGYLAQPQSLNRYAYVQGNPLLLTDPSGFAPKASPKPASPSPSAAPSAAPSTTPAAEKKPFYCGPLTSWLPGCGDPEPPKPSASPESLPQTICPNGGRTGDGGFSGGVNVDIPGVKGGVTVGTHNKWTDCLGPQGAAPTYPKDVIPQRSTEIPRAVRDWLERQRNPNLRVLPRTGKAKVSGEIYDKNNNAAICNYVNGAQKKDDCSCPGFVP